MGRSFKNWKWWLALPYAILFGLAVVLPMIVFRLLCFALVDASEFAARHSYTLESFLTKRMKMNRVVDWVYRDYENK